MVATLYLLSAINSIKASNVATETWGKGNENNMQNIATVLKAVACALLVLCLNAVANLLLILA
jgi:hypothetical protein